MTFKKGNNLGSLHKGKFAIGTGFKRGHKINLGKKFALGRRHTKEEKRQIALSVAESHKKKEYGFIKGVQNYDKRLCGIVNKNRVLEDKELIIKDYLEGKSIIKISRELKHNRHLISQTLKENGIRVRKNSEGITAWNKGKKNLPSSWNKGIKQWENKKHPRLGKHHTKETIEKLSNRKQTEEAKIKIRKARALQLFPIKDTSIEVKIQNYLKELKIDFFTHQYIKEIEHGYQCDPTGQTKIGDFNV